MDDLARGWAIVTQHWHSHGSWAVWIAVFSAIWIPAWIAIASERKKRKKPEIDDFRPIPRTPIPGSEKRIPGSDHRSQAPRFTSE